MKKFIWIFCGILIVSIVGVVAAHRNSADRIVASFRGEPVFKSHVELNMLTNEIGHEEGFRKSLERVLVMRILPVEAQARGFCPTPSEINEQMEELKERFREYDDSELVRSVNDALLKERISIDEYWEQVEETLPEHMAVARIMEDFNDADYQSHDEVSAAWEAFGRELLIKYADDIVIYDDRYKR